MFCVLDFGITVGIQLLFAKILDILIYQKNELLKINIIISCQKQPPKNN